MGLMFSEADLVGIDNALRSPTKGRDKIRAAFSKVPFPDPKETKTSGYPVYRDVFMITEFIDPLTTSTRPITTWRSTDPMNFHPMNDKEHEYSDHHCDEMTDDDRWIRSREWAAFLNGDQEQILGYRLTAFWAHNPSRALSFQHFGIMTVEQLADASDETIGRIAGGLEARELCRNYLANAKQQQPSKETFSRINHLEEQLSQKNDELAELRAMIKDVIANQGGSAVAKKLPGRPKKAINGGE